MSGSKSKTMEKVLSVILALIMVIGTMPTAVFAASTQYTDMFTISVKEGETALAGAAVAYSVTVDGDKKLDTTVTTSANEGVVAFDLSAYEAQIAESKVTVSYTVSKDGYTDKSAADVAVTDKEGNIDVALVKAPVTKTVTVAKTGNGTVLLNGVAQSSVTVNENSEVTVKITPDTGAYIKTLTVGGEAKTVEKGEVYEATLTAADDIDISVTLVNEFTLTAQAGENGKILLNGVEQAAVTVDENTDVAVKITPDEGYWIKTVTVDGTAQEVTDPLSFEKSVTVSKNIAVAAEFVKVYTVSVSYDGSGAVSTDPACSAGKVTVETGKTVKVTATPEENYRVVKVEINNDAPAEFTDNTYSKTNPYTKELTADKDYSVKVTFAPMIYTVTVVNSSENGKITVDKTTVEHGGNVKVTLAPSEGYAPSRFEVDGVNKSALFESEDLSAEIENITKDITITVDFAEVVATVPTDEISNSYYEITFSQAPTRSFKTESGTNVFVLPKGASAKISPQKPYFAVKYNSENIFYNYVSSVTIDKTTKINNVLTNWFNLNILKDGIKKNSTNILIVIDDKVNAPVITPEAFADGMNCYGKDFEVSVKATEPDAVSGMTAYSGIAKIEYWVTLNGIVTQGKDFVDESGVTDDGVLYTGSVAAAENDVTKGFTVDTSNNKYDYKNIEVHVKVTDFAGNTSEKTYVDIPVNTVAPAVEIAVSGEKHAEAVGNNYNIDRDVTVTFTDWTASFDKNAAAAAIKVNGKNVTGITWKLNTNAQVAKFKLTDNGTYAITVDPYKNTAGNTSDEKAYDEFTIDHFAPINAIIEVKGSFWDTLVETVTFGAWKRGACEVLATAEDKETGVQKILYYKTDGESELDKKDNAGKLAELDALYAANAFTDTAYSFTKDEEAIFVVYARITDNAGNTMYISTDGVIIDQTAPVISEIKTEGKGFEDVPDKYKETQTGYYYGIPYVNANGNILKFSFTVDNNSHAIFSGIKNVYYWVTCDGKVTQGVEKTLADSSAPVVSKAPAVKSVGDSTDGLLYSFDKTNPLRSELSGLEAFDVYVDLDKNNGENVQVHAMAEDNSGNQAIAHSKTFGVNTLTPTIELSFVDEVKPEAAVKEGYFKKRTATVKIVDYKDTFDTSRVSFSFTCKNFNGTALGDETKPEITWEGQTATVTFAENANYDWSVSYINKAGSSNAEIDTSKIKFPYSFTVDNDDPSGSVTINTSNKWDKLLNKLSFGLYDSDKAVVTAAFKDATSEVRADYYICNKDEILTQNELEALYTAGKFAEFPKDGLTRDDDEQFAVYMRFTDKGGNYRYISSDGYIVDGKICDISITPAAANGYYSSKDNANSQYGLYNKKSDVKVDISVADSQPYSGIKSVEYWVENTVNGVSNETQRKTLYLFDYIRDSGDNSNGGKLTVTDWNSEKQKNTEPVVSQGTFPTKDSLKNTWEGFVIVDKVKNNSCDVALHVKVTDNAGNVSEKSVNLDIDNTAPVIAVTYADTANTGAAAGYYTSRTATVVITERNHHFNAQDVVFTVTAKNAQGKDIAKAYTVSKWTTAANAENPDAATHTATVSFNKDANYTFDVDYTDLAGNAAAQRKVDSFTVDTTNPFGTVSAQSHEGRKDTRDNLINELTFGFWSNKKIIITSTSDDVTSPIAKVESYKVVSKEATDGTSALSYDDLEAINNWAPFKGFSVKPNEQFTVYLKITDKAGNYTYISTNGLIVDSEKPLEEAIAPEITLTPQQPINGIYNGDVKVAIEVSDPLVDGTYSGLKQVAYKVFDRAVSATVPTQEGVLYSFTKKQPRQRDLNQKLETSITVESSKNNSNDIMVVVYATDNSLNTSDDYRIIKIDTTAPVINVSYDNNSADSGSYFKAARTATVSVTERNFDEDAVVVNITNTEGVIPVMSGWTKKAGTGNLDNTTWSATIAYTADGDYTFGASCIDLAGNECKAEKYVPGTVAGAAFTIDRTLPVMTAHYDNNSAQNGKYFKANRTATVTVTEHNFDVSRVVLTRTAKLDGRSIAVPGVTWVNNGDVHTATIAYRADGDYTFDAKMTDMAGNANAGVNYGAAVAAKDFTIDTTITKPTLGGVENGKAYKDDVIPTITLNDVNFDSYEAKLTRTRMGEKNVDVTKQFIKAVAASSHGGTSSSNTFEKLADNDGIYTLNVKMRDKAGNEENAAVTFTVNRFGSVYDYSDYLVSLIEKAGAFKKMIEDNLVITEFNADRLLGDSLVIEITRDGKPLDDVKFDITPVINDKVAIGESGWFQYRYTISKDNFASDGVYKVFVSSKDATGNTPENSNFEDKSILFRVDSSAPEITSIVGLENKIINNQSVTVSYTAYDTIGLKSITVFVDGEKSGEAITDFGNDINKYTGAIELSEKSDEQSIRLLVEDLAGNITDTDAADFTSAYVFNRNVTVSTNIFVRWYANKPLFWGSIAGAVILVAAVWVIISSKRKKGKKEA